MKTEPNSYTFPRPEYCTDLYRSGLTKREYFAAAALQGVLANPHDNAKKTEGMTIDAAIARVAVNLADALIEALNKEQE